MKLCIPVDLSEEAFTMLDEIAQQRGTSITCILTKVFAGIVAEVTESDNPEICREGPKRMLFDMSQRHP